jgi:uncharacterized membrane protein YqjE
MKEREPAPDEKTPGAAGQARSFLAACARYASARFQLASIEGREAAAHGLKLIALTAAAVVLATFGWLFLCLATVFLLAKAFGGPHGWLWAALAMAGAHFIGVLLLALMLRAKLARKVFPMTIAEIKKDQEWLDQK